jgi:hypothetical protein
LAKLDWIIDSEDLDEIRKEFSIEKLDELTTEQIKDLSQKYYCPESLQTD